MKRFYKKPVFIVLELASYDVLTSASTVIDVGTLLGGDAHELWH